MSYKLRPSEPTEAQVLRDVLHALSVHPNVGCVWRANTGAGKLVRGSGASQWIRFGFKGQPDLMGYTAAGKALYVEVKRPSGKIAPEQLAFLEAARNRGCVAFVARSVDDVFAQMEFAG